MKQLFACFWIVGTIQVAAFSFLGRPTYFSKKRSSSNVKSSQVIHALPTRYSSSTSLFSTSKNDNNKNNRVLSVWDANGEELSRAEVQKLTVPQLKQQLRLRGLKVSGRKSELVDRLLAFSETTEEEEPDVSRHIKADVVDKKDESDMSKARKFAEERGKEFIDVTAYLDDEDKGKSVKSSAPADQETKEDDSDGKAEKGNPEVWGSQAKIVDDYEGRSVVVDNLSRTIVEFKGSNQTSVKAFVVASRDALKAFLSGGQQGQNETSTAEDRLREIQMKREKAAKVPVRDIEDDPGLDEGDETGIYKNIIERDFSDWGKYTQTGAQLSAAEVQGVLLLSDVYGAFTEDTRALAEKIAFECQPMVVMVPDLFRETPWQEEEATPGLNAEGQDYEQWRAMHEDLRVSVDIRAAAACLRERYGVSSVVVWGTCYGGGRALEAASGYLLDGNIHDVNGKVGPPPVDPLAAVAWYPTRYDAKALFGKNHEGSDTDMEGNKRSVAIMSIFAGKDTIPGATPDDAALLKSLLEKDERVQDHMVKVFPGQEHGFAHIGLGANPIGSDEDEFGRFVDDEFGGSGSVSMDGSDAEVACLLSTAWMETYGRVFLPTVGPEISKDENEVEWASLEMKDVTNSRNVREEMEEALDGFVEEPLSGRRIDQTDESQKEELAKLLATMQNGEEGPYKIDPDDDLSTIYAKLKASDENFQIF